MTTSSADLEKRLLAAAVFELRILLSHQLDADSAVGDAARMTYALHNEALAALEGRAFDVDLALKSLDRLEQRLGSHYLQHFAKVVRNEA